MDLNIKSVNNGYVIYDEGNHQPGLVRLGETTHIATSIDDLCRVLRKIHTAREAHKRPSGDVSK